MKLKFYYKINYKLTVVLSLIFTCFVFPQHRGDNLGYQGISFQNEGSVKASGMGGAYTSISGDINSLFYNPAGLSTIKKIQITVSANSFNKLWRENQEYRPNRYFVTLPFYLEGLYVPDPQNNGRWDYELAQDSSYYVNPPLMGKDPFSAEAADWQKERSQFGFNSAAAALPLNINGKSLVVSLGYNRNEVANFDRNDTYLSPDLGYTFYNGDITRVSGTDTLTVQWSNYLRSRFGSFNNFLGAVAYQMNEYLEVGARAKFIWGTLDDLQSLVRVGSFDLADQNKFRFAYQNVESTTSGTSDFSGTNFSLGAILNLDRFRVGTNLNLPYTLERKWDYVINYSDSMSSSSKNLSGTDKLKMPLSYSLGVSFTPIDEFTISFDYEYNPYKNAEFNFAGKDSTFRQWPNQKIIRMGLEYKPFKFLSLMAGYRNIPQPFIPDGAAVRDAGPDAVSYTFGVSVDVVYGRLDVSYELRRLKYYDSYYSNTNYNLITNNNLLFGYSISF